MSDQLLRSYLFAPGDNDRILAKVIDAGADAVVLDLEDAVAPSQKDVARTKVAALIAARGADAPCAIHVRVNLDGDGYSEADLRAVVAPGISGIRLPKCESASAVAAASALIDHLEAQAGLEVGSIALHTTIESALGAATVLEVAAATPRVSRCNLGSVDFLADVGAPDAAGELMDHVRRQLVLDSRVAKLGPPIDGVFTGVADLDGLRTAAFRARDIGMFGKSVIHPSHIAIVNEAFTPTDDEVAWAQRIVASFAASEAEGNASITVDGEFVDPAVVARARALLALVPDVTSTTTPSTTAPSTTTPSTPTRGA